MGSDWEGEKYHVWYEGVRVKRVCGYGRTLPTIRFKEHCVESRYDVTKAEPGCSWCRPASPPRVSTRVRGRRELLAVMQYLSGALCCCLIWGTGQYQETAMRGLTQT